MTEDEFKELVLRTREQVQNLIQINTILISSLEDINFLCSNIMGDDELDDEVRALSRLLANDCVKVLEAIKLLAINNGRMQ